MKTLILTIASLWSIATLAQENSRHFQYHAPEVNRISEADLAALNNTEWVVAERRFYLEDVPGTPTAYKYRLKFSESGSIFSGDKELGAWSLDRDKLLKITGKPDTKELASIQFLGSFSLNWLDDNALLLTKTLTTDFQNKVDYKLIPLDAFAEYAVYLDHPIYNTSAANRSSPDKLPYSPVRNKVQAEYFMRGMRLPENFFELKDRELQQLLDNLKKG